ncbi:MAG: PRC-barrel domain-containing protein [Verrucomicrobia bacterium]|nr:PRC-barrel domain-containing protein [Verrucomicrobiota bacterium]
MKSKFLLFLATALGFGALSSLPAQTTPDEPKLGLEKPANLLAHIQVENLQGQTLGRISELGVDLVNGRIVEVLVVSGDFLDIGGKITAVPATALIPDPDRKIYRLDISRADFKAAPAIKLSEWDDANRSDRVAAAYRRFGQTPYFLEAGQTANPAALPPKVTLGRIERSSSLVGLPVNTPQNTRLGKVSSLTLNLETGRIVNVIILAPGNFQTRSVVPAMALAFSPDRRSLVLDDTKAEFEQEPRYVSTPSANGQAAYYREESYHGPRTYAPLEQGRSYRDKARTSSINRSVGREGIAARHIQVGTLNGRVTLRGWVDTQAAKDQINRIAVSASRLELVDNQITVGAPSPLLPPASHGGPIN